MKSWKYFWEEWVVVKYQVLKMEHQKKLSGKWAAQKVLLQTVMAKTVWRLLLRQVHFSVWLLGKRISSYSILSSCVSSPVALLGGVAALAPPLPPPQRPFPEGGHDAEKKDGTIIRLPLRAWVWRVVRRGSKMSRSNGLSPSHSASSRMKNVQNHPQCSSSLIPKPRRI